MAESRESHSRLKKKAVWSDFLKFQIHNEDCLKHFGFFDDRKWSIFGVGKFKEKNR